MIRFKTDINHSARAIFIRDLVAEKIAMRNFVICGSIAFIIWMSGAAALAVFSREVAEFVVEHF